MKAAVKRESSFECARTELKGNRLRVSGKQEVMQEFGSLGCGSKHNKRPNDARPDCERYFTLLSNELLTDYNTLFERHCCTFLFHSCASVSEHHHCLTYICFLNFIWKQHFSCWVNNMRSICSGALEHITWSSSGKRGCPFVMKLWMFKFSFFSVRTSHPCQKLSFKCQSWLWK